MSSVLLGCMLVLSAVHPPASGEPFRLFPVAVVQQLGDDGWCVQLAAVQHWLHALPARIYKKSVFNFIFCSFFKFIVLSPGFDLWDKMVNNTSML